MPEIQTLANSDVLYRYWPAEETKAVLLLVHGLGAHGARWNFLADYFSSNGYACYAIELKGFGRTKDRPRGHIDSFDIYYSDILALTAQIKKDNPGKKVYLLGESLGGLIAFILSILSPDTFAGLILISPAFQNKMKFPLSSYLTLLAFILINPRKSIPVPFVGDMCTTDADYQKVMDQNPDEYRAASLKMLVNILLAQLRAKMLVKKLIIPTLFLLAGNDLLVDKRASQRIFDRLNIKEKHLIEYPGMYHALSIEKGRGKVFADILGWLNERFDVRKV